VATHGSGASARKKPSDQGVFRIIAAMSNDGILAFGEDGEIIFANEAASLITGYEEDRLLGKDIVELLGTEAGELLGHVNGAGTKVCREMRITGAGGEQRDLYLCLALAKADTEEVKGVAYLTDITELKRFERQFVASERRYWEVLHEVGEGLFISNPEGQFTYVNRALVDMLGYKNEQELLAIDLPTDLYVDPIQRDVFREMMERQGYVRDWEVEFKRKDGVPITVLLTAHALRDDEGNITGYQGINIDITPRKRLERQLKAAHDFLSNLIESSVDGIIASDMKGDVILFNKMAEELTGYEADEVIGKKHITELYPPGVAQEVMRMLRSPDYGGEGRLTGYQVSILDRNGETVPIQLVASIIYEEGQEVATVGFFHDLRAKLAMEKHLRDTQLQLLQSEKLRALGEMAAGVAHEINNPLGGVLIFANLLKDEISLEDSRRGDVERISHEALRCKEIVKSLLEFAHQTSPSREPVDVNQIIRDGLHFFERQVLFHNIELVKRLQADLPKVYGNPGQIKQVVMNVMANAAEAMEGQGTIIITTRTEKGGWIAMEFKDEGPGIPEDVLPKIFEPFFTTKGVGKGTGLGLSLCYGIVKEHEGDIHVDTRAGQGTVFRILLPVMRETVQEIPG